MTDGEKEQIKLKANALDRASTACFAAGLLTPLANVLYNGSANPSSFTLVLSAMAYLVIALCLHHFAVWHLEKLDK